MVWPDAFRAQDETPLSARFANFLLACLLACFSQPFPLCLPAAPLRLCNSGRKSVLQEMRGSTPGQARRPWSFSLDSATECRPGRQSSNVSPELSRSLLTIDRGTGQVGLLLTGRGILVSLRVNFERRCVRLVWRHRICWSDTPSAVSISMRLRSSFRGTSRVCCCWIRRIPITGRQCNAGPLVSQPWSPG